MFSQVNGLGQHGRKAGVCRPGTATSPGAAPASTWTSALQIWGLRHRLWSFVMAIPGDWQRLAFHSHGGCRGGKSTLA